MKLKVTKISFIVAGGIGVILGTLFILGESSHAFWFGKPIIHVYHYESSDRYFASFEVPEKSRTLKSVELAFEEYKKSSGRNNSKLCRTFKMNIFKFYEWRDYLTNPRWKYPYIVPSSNPNEDWRGNYKNKKA